VTRPLALLFAIAAACAGAEPAAVPFSAVEIDSAYWKTRQQTNRMRTIPHLIRMCEAEGRVRNLQRAAGRLEGGYEGNRGHDADLFKVIEAASYTLAKRPDAKLDGELDRLIEIIAAAQRADGYLHTPAQLSTAAGKRPTRLNLFAAGHLIAAGVAHFESTGKRSLLNVAARMANLIASQYGPDAKIDVPDHSIVESALMRLAELSGKGAYRDLAAFFINERGEFHRSGRKSHGLHNVDDLPLRQRKHAEGHVIGNLFVWLGTHDVGRWSGDASLLSAARGGFEDAVSRRMYLTGATGRQSDERFTDPFALENRTSLGEGCQSAMSIRLAHRFWLETRHARYADFIERVVYNNLAANVGLDGTSFYYYNRLSARREDAVGRPYAGIVKETDKQFLPRNCLARQPWFSVPCCPPNVASTVATLGGYVYAAAENAIWVNQYVAGWANVSCGRSTIAVRQATDYPWSGAVRAEINPVGGPWKGTIHLRIPEWARSTDLSRGLYRIPKPASWTLAVNRQIRTAAVDSNGYTSVQRDWQPGDTIDLNIDMPILRVRSRPEVAANLNHVAIQRGPQVYCFEGVDHAGNVRNLGLPPNAELQAEWRANLLGGVMIIRCDRLRLLAIPYGYWANRQAGEMDVWITEQ
jgi:uncharacterized protein